MRDIEREKKLKDLLYSYTYIEFEIESINQQIIDLGEVITSQRDVKVPVLSASSMGSGISDPVYASVEKIMITYGQEVAKLETRLEKAFRKRNQISSLLTVLDPIEKKVIELKFFKKYRNWMIAATVNYSERQVNRYLDSALNKLNNDFKINMA